MRIAHDVMFEAKIRLATGASTLALSLAIAATPSHAQQVVVGGPQCVVVAGTATCEGNLSGGVTSQQRFGHVPVRTINIRNTTAPIAPTTGIFGIGADRSEGPLTVNISDGTVINVFDNLTIPEPAQGVIIILRGGNALVIDSGATITSNAGGLGTGGPGAGIEGAAFGVSGSVAITNRGQITSNSTTHRSTAIAGLLFTGANGNITVANSGALFANSTATGERNNVVAGVFASDDGTAPIGGLITVNNTGAITVRTDPNAANTVAGGNAAAIVTNGLSSDSNTTITNSGALDSQGQRANGIFAFSRGNVLTGDTSIVVENTGTMRIDGTGSGILAQTQGEKVDIALRNRATGVINITGANGSNTPSTGILALSQARTGVLSIDNAATITTAGTGFSRGIGITTGGAPAGGNYTMSIANSANITIGTTSGQGLRIDATRDDTATATVTNTGAISLSATTTAGGAGITVNLGLTGTGDGATSATITNSGAITVGSGNGIAASADVITVTNSGAINTANATSDAVTLVGTGTGAIALTSSANIRAQGANSDAIAIYGTASGATINLSGAAVQAPTGIANSENFVVRVAGDINTVLTPTNGTTLTGNMIFAGGNDRIDVAAGNQITGNLALGAGNDSFDFATGTFRGSIDLGAGDDTITVNNFTVADAIAIGAIEGGAGNDTLNLRLRDGDALNLTVGPLQITNVETVAQSGLGSVTFTGAAPTLNFLYELRQGTLSQNAALVNANLATLAGTSLNMSGSVRNLTVAGTISPLGATSGIGAATVGGDFVFASTATYNVDLTAAGASDQIIVAGRATLNGGTVRPFTTSLESAFATNTSYAIVTAAGGLTGTFGTVSTTNLPFLNLSLTYTANAALLNIRRSVVTTASVAQTFNQIQVANVVDATQNGATGDYRTVLDALVFATTPQALTALDTSSGEIHASVLAAGLRQSRVIGNAMQSRIHAGPVQSDGGNRFGLWLAGGIVDGAIAADGNAARVGGNSQGMIFGGELAGASGNFVVGAAVGYAKSRVDVSARQSSAKLDGWQAGAYGRFGTGGSGFTVSALGSYVSSNADTQRGITVNTINRTATARYKVQSTSIGGEARLGIPVGASSWAVGPVAAFDYTNVRRAAFTEGNAASLNLTGNSDSHNLTSYGVGGFANWQGKGGKFDLSVMYDRGDRAAAATRLALQGAPASSFIVRSPLSVRDGVRIGLTSELALGSGWGIGAGYRGRIAGVDSDHSAVLSLIWRQ